MSLIYIPIPNEDESAASLILRATEKNGYRSSTSFIYAYNLKVHTKSLNAFFANREKFRILLNHLELDSDYEKLAPLSVGPTKRHLKELDNQLFPESFLSADATKLCPSCIAEKLYLRKIWLFKHLTVCIEHKTKLISECPNCGTLMTANRRVIHLCYHCEYDFREQECIESINSGELKANEWFISCLEAKSLINLNKINKLFNTINSTRNLYSNIKIYLSDIVIAYYYFNNKIEYQNSILKIAQDNINIIHPRLLLIYFIAFEKKNSENLYNLFSELSTINCATDSFEYFFSQRLACIALNISASTLHRNYLPDLSSTSKISSKFIEDILAGKKKKINPIEIELDKYCDIKQLTRLLAINYDLANKLFYHSNIFQVESLKLGSKTIKVIKLKDLLKFNKKYILASCFAEALSINPAIIYKRLKFINILPVYGPEINEIPINIYLRKDLENITKEQILDITNYERRTVSKSFLKFKLHLEIQYICERLKINKMQFNKLVKFGLIEKWDYKEHKCFFNRRKVNDIFRLTNSNDYLTIEEARDVLQVSKNWFFKYWVITGFIEVIDLCLWRLVSKQQVEKVLKIKEIYFTGVEASKFLGMQSSHVTNLASQEIITPVYLGKGPKIRLFKKEDIFALKGEYSKTNYLVDLGKT
ncbi:TniQ family protein [Acinetobacter modestus]|uniref:TniQ family protein n=1 Tax=Acinetobacter modestus TaxID=1776740 RepID=UPI001F4BA190|nr:TniQ family protein [Acinetobacter modestus]MCH7332135.1 TniQ family protein [Acinetobacter modestus]